MEVILRTNESIHTVNFQGTVEEYMSEKHNLYKMLVGNGEPSSTIIYRVNLFITTSGEIDLSIYPEGTEVFIKNPSGLLDFVIVTKNGLMQA